MIKMNAREFLSGIAGILLAGVMLASACESASAVEIPQYEFHYVPNNAYYGGIHGIAKDKVGRIWFSGHEALCLYDGNGFRRMEDEVMGIAPMDPWNFGEVKIAGSEGRLFIGSNHGLILFSYEDMSFDCIFPGNIGPFDVTDDGKVWMVRDGRLEMFLADSISSGVAGLGLMSGLAPEESVSSVFCSGNEVYASVRNVLMSYSAKTGTFRRFAVVGGDDTEIKDVLRVGDTVYVLT